MSFDVLFKVICGHVSSISKTSAIISSVDYCQLVTVDENAVTKNQISCLQTGSQNDLGVL